MHIRYVKPTKGFNFYVEPGYITTCVSSGMKLVDFHLNKPVYEFDFNELVAINALEITITNIGIFAPIM